MIRSELIYFICCDLFALNERPCLWIYSEHNERGNVYSFLHSGTVLALLISPDSLKSCFSPLLENCRIFLLQKFLCSFHTLKSEMLRFGRVIFFIIFFLNRDVGSINNIIDSPGAKLLEDRRQANLIVNSQACHPQTSLWVSSCDAQYSLAKKNY